MLLLLTYCTIANGQGFSNDDVTVKNDKENATMLLGLARQNASWSGFDVYEDLIKIGEMIKNREEEYEELFKEFPELRVWKED